MIVEVDVGGCLVPHLKIGVARLSLSETIACVAHACPSIDGRLAAGIDARIGYIACCLHFACSLTAIEVGGGHTEHVIVTVYVIKGHGDVNGILLKVGSVLHGVNVGPSACSLALENKCLCCIAISVAHGECDGASCIVHLVIERRFLHAWSPPHRFFGCRTVIGECGTVVAIHLASRRDASIIIKHL